MRLFNLSIVSGVYNRNLSKIFLRIFRPNSITYSTKITNKNVLNSLLASVDKDFLNDNNFQFIISPEYDDLFKSLDSLQGSNDVLGNDHYTELKITAPTLFKTCIDKEYGGIGMNHSNFAYLIERLRSNTHISYLMMVNQLLCSKAISMYGNDNQKSEYLTKLSNAQSICSFCLHELSSGNNMYLMEGRGTYCNSTDTFKVSATKNWIFNAQFMDMCIVFVKMKNEKGVDCISAFVKDNPLNDPGIRVIPRKNILNVTNVADVEFVDVSFSKNDMLGKVGDGFQIALQLQNSARFAITAALLGITKNALSKVFQIKSPSSAINAKIAKGMKDIFIVESALYFTTKIADDYSLSTFDSEFAALKVQASKAAFDVINGCIDVARWTGTDDTYFVNLLDKIRGLELFLGSRDVLTHFIGGVAIKYILPQIGDSLLKLNNSDNDLMWTYKFSIITSLPEEHRQCKIDENYDFLVYAMEIWRKEIIRSLSVFGFNAPNQDSMQVRIGSLMISAYHLYCIIGRYNGLVKEEMTNERKVIIKDSMDTLRNEIIDAIGSGFDRMPMYVNNTKNRAVSKMVTKSEVHGIESPIARNW